MTPTSVGMRCPECSRERTQVRTAASLSTEPIVTYILIGLNVAAFVGELAGGSAVASRGGGSVIDNGALFGPAIAHQHEYWRLVTGAFLHAGLIHIAFNMYLLWILGGILEPALGRVRFAGLYLVSLLGGSFGGLLASPHTLTVGASGAVFGLMGAAVVVMRARGFDPRASGLPMLILINLLFTFVFPGISIGGHIGGLVAGGATGWLLERMSGQWRSLAPAVLLCLALAAGEVGGALAVAGGNGL
jgi:membrane associated rhomboid family serine protease